MEKNPQRQTQNWAPLDAVKLTHETKVDSTSKLSLNYRLPGTSLFKSLYLGVFIENLCLCISPSPCLPVEFHLPSTSVPQVTLTGEQLGFGMTVWSQPPPLHLHAHSHSTRTIAFLGEATHLGVVRNPTLIRKVHLCGPLSFLRNSV